MNVVNYFAVAGFFAHIAFALGLILYSFADLTTVAMHKALGGKYSGYRAVVCFVGGVALLVALTIWAVFRP